MKVISNILHSKVFLYIFSRYVTYIIQFITSVYIAIYLGPYYFGVYGFILLLLSYISTLNFGITHSATVLLVQNKTNKNQISKIVSNSIFLISLISLIIALLCIVPFFIDVDFMGKYDIESYFLFLPVIGILSHFNILFLTIYRFKNKLFEVGFLQTFRPFLVLISMFLGTKENLLKIILWAFVFGELIPMLLFIFRGQLSFKFTFSYNLCKEIVVKAIYLFVYLSSFGMILITTRSFISYYYSVANFGLFTFSFSLANSVLLFLQALTFLFTPKILDKLNSKNNMETIGTIENVNTIYVTFSYLLLYVSIILFPFFLDYFPKWRASLPTLNSAFLSIMMISNSFSFSSYLMSNNKEKILSLISLLSLFFNVIFSAFLIYYVKVEMEVLILSPVISYLIFGFLSSYFTYKMLSQYNLLKIFLSFFPLRLLIPFVILLSMFVLNISWGSYVSILIFLVLNIKELRIISSYFKKTLYSSSLIDL